MEYKVEYLNDKRIISIKMKGRLSFQMAEKYSKEAIKLAHQNDCTYFLFDHSETEMQAGINKIHTSGEELQQFGFKDKDRIAIVISNDNQDLNSLQPASHNSRWSVFKYFYADDIQEAFNWLLDVN